MIDKRTGPIGDIRDITFEELQAYLVKIGEKPFRATQIFEWLYKKTAHHFSEMRNIPRPLQEALASDFHWAVPHVAAEDVSVDGTRKVLFDLQDKEKVETVLIPTETRATVCVSTQAGCKFGCRFCASGIGGWSRNLSCAEIVSQVLYMKRASTQRPLSNIVFMGIGEPLDNYDNLLKAIRLINSERAINIGARKITISTCGVVPRIKQLATEGMQIELAISLHGSSNISRDVLMPVNKKYPVAELIDACRMFQKATKRQLTFEYILIKDVTCTEKAARELSTLLKGLLCKMNLIPYNKVAEFDHEPPSHQEMLAFRTHLERAGIMSTIRMPRGRDVSAACGQLRHATKTVSA